jgi:Uma2 family endonuclease
MLTAPRVTAAEYLLQPETTHPTALINGEVITMPAPTPEHQDVVLDLGAYLKSIVKAKGGRVFVAPLDVYLDEYNVPQPDVMVLLPGSACEVGEKRLIGAPDMIVEVLSPGTARHDRKIKFRLYERFGVKEYWLVDLTEKLIDVWGWDDGRYVLVDIYSAGETIQSPLLGAVAMDGVF